MARKDYPRILSLDSGGVRGLSSLLILRQLMEEIGRRKRTVEMPLPCQYFDFIGGTGSGGLIAIVLHQEKVPSAILAILAIVVRKIGLILANSG